MPTLKMGSKASFEQGGVFVQLKSKNEQVHFRIVKDPTYTGKHFLKTSTGWDIQECPRIMRQEECDTCNKYFEAIAPRKELKKQMKEITGTTKEDNLKKAELQVQIDEIDKKARPWKPTVSFFYPIIDREDHKAKIFQTTTSIRLSVDEELQAGINVLDYDYKVVRTEKPGKYYSFNRMPEATLSEDEEREKEKAMNWDMDKMVGGKKSEQLEEAPQGVVEEMPQEPVSPSVTKEGEINPDDIPF